MPIHTESIVSVRRERSRTELLRQQIREALSKRGTVQAKRAARMMDQNDQGGS
jgi:hypothetical protein